MGQHRSSPVVDSLRLKTPYVAFAPRVSHAHPTPSPPPSDTAEQPTSQEPDSSSFRAKSSWISNCGYGSRHISDLAPFSLWDDSRQEFRLPTEPEMEWIFKTFRPTSVGFFWPEIVIETPVPPSPVPLTVACVTAIFTPSDDDSTALVTQTLSYSNPRIADPVPQESHLGRWERPSEEKCEKIFEGLQKFANIQAINFVSPILIVELRADDGRSYNRHSLPGRVGGRTTIYHHSSIPFWKTASQGQERLMNPNDTTQDTTNYLSELHTLCPGVRVESGTVDRDGGFVDATMATTAGVLVRSSTDGQRLTVSNHGFLNFDEVYHPSASGTCIGQITERFEALDIALVKLFPSTNFTNANYFQAQPPKRLLHSNQVRDNIWCSLDSMASGPVFLRVRGVRVLSAVRPPNVMVPFCEFEGENILQCIGPAGGEVRDGICGATIVIDDDEDGSVVGFFQLGEQKSLWALSPCLDDLVTREWTLV